MPTLFFGLCAFTIVCAVVLGGSTRGGFLSDGILQFLSLPLLLVSLWRIFDLPSGTGANNRPYRRELLFCGAIALVPLLQLVPLPPWIWSALPGRMPEEQVFGLLGAMPWMPISMSPEATWLSVLSLIPPLAIFLGCILLGYRERRLMSLVVLSVGLVSVFLGLLQVSQGPSSPLRFFAFTNPTEAVGFFANRNHLAALLYGLTLLAAAWAIEAAFVTQPGGNRNRYDGLAIVALVASFTVLIILVSAQAMARSRTGLGLTMLAVFGALALAYWDRRTARGKGHRRLGTGVTPAKVLLGATALGIVLSVQFALYRVMERFAAIDPLEDARTLFARSTIEAAKEHMPFGSGMGTFVPMYAMYEKVHDTLINGYVNHAHDDILELWLETGVVGIVLMGVFVMWLVLRSMKLWRPAPLGAREVDHSLARAATLIIGLLILHSFLDYPLRTSAMMAIMAFACALLIEPPPGSASELEVTSSAGEKLMRRGGRQAEVQTRLRPVKVSSRSAAPAIISPRRPAELFGEDVPWPEAWRKPASDVSPKGVAVGSIKPPKT